MSSSNSTSRQVARVETPAALHTAGQRGEIIQAQEPGCPVSITINVNTVALPARAQRTLGQSGIDRLAMVARSKWMPWYPFGVIGKHYWARHGALAATHPGLMKPVLAISAATCIAASAWRPATLPISMAGGVLAFLVIAGRTGMLRELICALEDAGRMPPIVMLLRHTWRTVPAQVAAELDALHARAEAAAARLPTLGGLWYLMGQVLRSSGSIGWERLTDQDGDAPRGGTVS